MRLLLDTHVVLWWLDDDDQLTPRARAALVDTRNQLSVSAASTWEISIKSARGKLRTSADIARALRDADIIELPISAAHSFVAGELPPHHADPFDRMLVAQAQLERLTLMSADPVFSRYDVELLSL